MPPLRSSRVASRLGRRILLGASALAVAAAAARADNVNLVPGSTFKQAQGGIVRGIVQSESPSEVVVQLGASTISVPTDQIAGIEYNGQTQLIQLGETRMNAGQYDDAAAQFKKAAADSAGKPFIIEAAQIREAQALAESALIDPDRMKDAKDRFAAFIRAHPNSRHIAAAREGMARLQMRTEDYAGAEASVAELAKLPRASERAAVLKARLLSRRGDYGGAVAELDKLIAALPDKSARRREAKLAKAESLAGGGKFEEAESLVREVIAASPAEDVAAQSAAYNTLGDCLVAAKRHRDAVLAYLHTDLLYAKDKEEHPRALYQLSRMFREIGNTVRAEEYAQRLKQEYPRSAWTANLAKEAGGA
jgi:tetratricopeptide (TPR) repeat protein